MRILNRGRVDESAGLVFDGSVYSENIINSMDDALIVTDIKANIVRANASACQLAAWNREDLIGAPLGVIIADQSVNFFQSIKEIINTGAIKNSRVSLKRKNGKSIPVLLNGSALRDKSGKLIGIVFVAKDLREINKLIDSLKAANTEIKKYNEKLKAANDELKKLDVLKSDFISNVSHEFRTPLTSIKAFTEILLSSDMQDPRTTREFMTIINDEADRLTRLINNVLDLHKIESEKANWTMTCLDIREVAKKVINSLRSLSEKKGLIIEHMGDVEPLYVLGDEDALIQVVTNLISNAIKFTPENGSVTVRAYRDGGSNVRVDVIDTGIGIKEEDYETVFSKFEQVKHKGVLTDKPQGTGLGLPICKEIIEGHSGDIWLESEFGKGSCFSFKLPVMDLKEVDRLEREKSAEGSDKYSMLLINIGISDCSAEELSMIESKIIKTIREEDHLISHKDKKMFVVFSPTDKEISSIIAQRIMNSFKRAFTPEKVDTNITIAILSYPDEVSSKEELIKKGQELIGMPIDGNKIFSTIQK